ncbi:MAG: hypothetical protein GX096_02315 [Clostridiales bacterium]|nr:hypothetical protein [Clostridiales bacterium]
MNSIDRLHSLLDGECANYIFPFFWQHGEDEATLRHYMHVIKESNIHAVCVESRPHPDFLGAKWWADMDAILDEAQKLSMKVWILDDEHFPTGYAAGAVETAAPELCHQYMDYNTVDVCGPMPSTQLCVSNHAHPKPTPPWMPQGPPPKRVFHDDKLYRVLAYSVEDEGNLGDCIDLTPLVKDGNLLWDVPSGYWKIFIVYLTRDAKGRNDYINMIDEDSCRLLIDTVYEPHYARYKSLFGTVIAGFFSDEPPIGNTGGYTSGDLIGDPQMALPWSAAMPAAMAEEFGEGWEAALPLLWAASRSGHVAARIRSSYMNAVSKLVSSCFSDQIGQWCESRGVEYIGHMLEDCDMSSNLGPSMGHYFRGLSGQHMAGIDNIGGQVVIGGQHVKRRPGGICEDDAGFYHYTLGRLGASLAAIDPKKKGRCLVENYGAYGWQIGVRTEKYLTDHFLARGVNRHVPHAFSPMAFPDPDCPPHFYAHGENPQYRAFGQLMAYTNRISHLIDGGTCVADVALLYGGESRWAGECESNIAACRELTRSQIGFTFVTDDVFAQPDVFHMSFDREHRILHVNGMALHTLVISGCEYMPHATASFAATAVAAGFPVLFTGRLPMGISDCDEAQSNALLQRLSSCRVVPVKKLAATVRECIQTDVSLSKTFSDLTVYHYQHGQSVYLFLNESPTDHLEASIALHQSVPCTRYDPWENQLYAIESSEKNGRTLLQLSLAPLEMWLVIAGENVPAATAATPMQNPKELVLDDWQVRLATAKEHPHYGAPMPTKLVNMGLQYPDFSGYFHYETTLALETAAHAILTIDDAYESAEVFVNGQSVGMKTAQPYCYDLAHLLQCGENSISIEVATTLQRHAAAMGGDVACMNIPAPTPPTGIAGHVTLTISEE